MKIVQIINSLATGGAEKLLIDIIPKYRAQGIHVDIILLWDNNHPFTNTLKTLKCCKVIVLNESGNERDIYRINNIFKLRKLLRNYDIAHVHLFPSLYFVRLASIGVKIKLVFTEHSTHNKRIANRKYNLIESWCYKSYIKVICITHEIKEILSNHLKTPSKLRVIENGVDIYKVTASVPYIKYDIHELVQKSDILIIQVSSFTTPKDQDTLISSLQHLPSNYKVLLVGDGPRKDKLNNLVLSLGLEKRVIFLGLRMDVPNLLKSVDIVVLSSHYEGLSLASIEGMASGKPFIASNVPGLKDVVAGAGILFERGDTKTLAREINKLIDNPEHYKRVAQDCEKRAEQYDIDHMVNKHIDLYREVYQSY